MASLRFRSMQLALLALVAGCGRSDEGASNNVDAPAPVVEPQTNEAELVPERALDRAAFLDAVRRAASAAAAGTGDIEWQRSLNGRQFEIRIRFGCAGPEQSLKTSALGWSYEQDDRTLRVRAKPTLTQEQPEAAALALEGTEAVEGFWLPRPWLLQAVCPSGAAIEPPSAEQGAEPLAEPPRTGAVGIAEFFTSDDARTGRRHDRAYESVKVLDKDQPIGSQGFDLVLSGRLSARPDKRVIACTAPGRDLAPNCIASADIDRVRIEQPVTGEIVAEWSRS